MQQLYYLLALTISICCLLFVDSQYKLAFWYNRFGALCTIGITMFVFILWDILGISLGIFFKGTSKYMLPFVLAPEFPLEELFFLFLLSYVTLLLYRGMSVWQRT